MLSVSTQIAKEDSLATFEMPVAFADELIIFNMENRFRSKIFV